jgi:hypothetical protein
MILSPNQARLVLAGKKTQVRIPVVEPTLTRRTRKVAGQPVPHGPEYTTQPFHPHVGRLVPISTLQTVDGKQRAVPHSVVLVTDYRHALLGDSLDDQGKAARAEGHRSTDEFKAWWVGVYDRSWINTYIKRHEIEPGDDILIERFDRRHTLRSVWVMVFEPDRTAAPRYLAPTGRGDDRGYTTVMAQAIADEPEAVDETMQRRISDQGREYDEMRAAGVDELLIDGLRKLRTQRHEFVTVAGERGINVRDEIRMLDRAQASLERKIHDQRTARRAA